MKYLGINLTKKKDLYSQNKTLVKEIEETQVNRKTFYVHELLKCPYYQK
jgi:hypothetical protein